MAIRRRQRTSTKLSGPVAVSAESVDGRDVLLSALSEKAFQAEVVRALRSRGWVVWTVPNMLMTTRGLPDVLAYHPKRPGLFLAYELKRERRSVTSPAQAAAVAHLTTVPGIDARIVRPSEWPALRDALLAAPPDDNGAIGGG